MHAKKKKNLKGIRENISKKRGINFNLVNYANCRGKKKWVILYSLLHNSEHVRQNEIGKG